MRHPGRGTCAYARVRACVSDVAKFNARDTRGEAVLFPFRVLRGTRTADCDDVAGDDKGVMDASIRPRLRLAKRRDVN